MFCVEGVVFALKCLYIHYPHVERLPCYFLLHACCIIILQKAIIILYVICFHNILATSSKFHIQDPEGSRQHLTTYQISRITREFTKKKSYQS